LSLNASFFRANRERSTQLNFIQNLALQVKMKFSLALGAILAASASAFAPAAYAPKKSSALAG